MDLVKYLAKFEANVFGSEIEIWGDEKSTSYLAVGASTLARSRNNEAGTVRVVREFPPGQHGIPGKRTLLEYERELISERTRARLATARAAMVSQTTAGFDPVANSGVVAGVYHVSTA